MTLDSYPIDKEYIGVEKRRADIQTTEANEDPLVDRSLSSVCRHNRFGEGESALSREEQQHRARDEASYISHDGRARDTRTTLFPSDGATSGPLRSDGKRIPWERLAKWNDGLWEDRYSTRASQANQRRDAAIFSSQLDLTTTQQHRVTHIANDLDMSQMAHYSSEVVTLTIISLVANEGGRWIRDEAKFREFVLALDTSLKDIKSCRRLLKEKTEL